MREVIQPRDESHWLEMRAMDITSTEISALFHLSPYQTEFELFHLKKGNIASSFELNDRSKWGQRLQDSIAVGIAEDQGWQVRKMTEYMRLPDLKIGSSFDFAIQNSFPTSGSDTLQDDGLLEIKNVDALIFRDGWIIDEDKNLEAPTHIELQVQHQMLVSGLSYAFIGALVGGNRVILTKREADEAIQTKIKAAVSAFWQMVDSGLEPKPDFKRDFETIRQLNQYAQPNKVIDADSRLEELMAAYKEYSKTEKEAAEEKESIKAEILTLVGDAEKVIGQSFTLSLGTVAESQINYTRKPYRLFKPTFKKQKES